MYKCVCMTARDWVTLCAWYLGCPPKGLSAHRHSPHIPTPCRGNDFYLSLLFWQVPYLYYVVFLIHLNCWVSSPSGNNQNSSRVFKLKITREWVLNKFERSTLEPLPPTFPATRRMLIGGRRGEWRQEKRMEKLSGPHIPSNPFSLPSLSSTSSFAFLEHLPYLSEVWVKNTSLSEVSVTWGQESHSNTVSLPENEFLKLPTHRRLQMKMKPQTPECYLFAGGGFW